MKIRSFRLGAATNSSSSHSVVFCNGVGDYDDGESSFGWGHFTLASPEAKQEYLDAQWNTSIMDWEEMEAQGLKNVDHQSVWQWPKVNGQPDRRVYELVKKELMKDGVVVLGGNDNGGEHHLEEGHPKVPLFELLRNGDGVRIREDPVGKWITVLAPYTYAAPAGVKLRMGDVDPVKSYTPELMDIKITDYCHFGCKFCYQGSTTKGKHASLYRMEYCVDRLRELDVMEVALGGGEPLEHPHFREFCQMLWEAGIVVNVTTKHNIPAGRWNRKDAFPHVQKFGRSIQSAKEVQDYSDVCYHVVLGTLPMSEVYNILMKADSTLLLDFKTTHRGASGPTHDYSNWLETVRAVKHNRMHDEDLRYDTWQVGIDTPLAKKFQTELREIGVPDLLYETEEGKHSAYWDLVTNEFGPCSYAPEKMVKAPKGADSEWFRRTFSLW
jgi:hypothetical protein